MTVSVDPALLQMFAAEVDTHMAALNDGLLALEQSPGQSERFESLMRAAHSIKGAAKLIGLDAAVEIAHAIEDCFTTARAGRTVMTSGLIDVLLEGVDLLGRATQVNPPTGTSVTRSQVSTTLERILRATSGAPAATASERPSPPSTTTRLDSSVVASASPSQQRVMDANWVGENHRSLAAAWQREQAVTFDLADVNEIDPLGLALLCYGQRFALNRKFPFQLRQVPSQFVPLLQGTGLLPVDSSSHMEDR
jgi:chemotaxis protein histidine kinase CheA